MDLKKFNDDELGDILSFCFGLIYSKKLAKINNIPYGNTISKMGEVLFPLIKDEMYIRNQTDEIHEIIKDGKEAIDKNFDKIIEFGNDMRDFIDDITND